MIKDYAKGNSSVNLLVCIVFGLIMTLSSPFAGGNGTPGEKEKKIKDTRRVFHQEATKGFQVSPGKYRSNTPSKIKNEANGAGAYFKHLIKQGFTLLLTGNG